MKVSRCRSSFAKRLPHHSFTIPQTPQFFQQGNPNSRTFTSISPGFVCVSSSLAYPSISIRFTLLSAVQFEAFLMG
ncbi:hypothetical protein L1887_38564 [Cichorium endivia]|nr:hypothetical protein L1887_38564 [Cichorium endivia]